MPLGAWLERDLSPLASRLTLVFYDPRHRGRSHSLSDTTAASFSGDVEDMETVRRELGISRVAVIGFDYYAAVAAAWAASHPQEVTRVVLLAPMEPADSLVSGWNPPERLARLDTAAARQLVKDRAAGRDTLDPAGYCRSFWRVNAFVFVADSLWTAGLGDDWCQLPNESPARLAASSAPAIASLGPGADAGARATSLAAPLLVIHGRQDLVANPAGALQWARQVPGARVLFLSGVGHLPQREAAKTVLEAIADFLDGRWPPRATPPSPLPPPSSLLPLPSSLLSPPVYSLPVQEQAGPHGRSQQVEADQALQGRNRRQARRAVHQADS